MIEQRAKAFDFIFDAVVVTDLSGRVVDWNRGAERLYGWSRQEILGQPLSVLHAPADQETLTQEVLGACVREGRWHGEVRMRHKDGRLGHVESIVVPVDRGGRIVGAIAINRDISSRIAAEERLQFLAFHDALTGLGNRALAMDRLQHAVASARRRGTKVAALFIDLDGFKRVNDEFGHAGGDEVLREVGRRLLATLRADDTVARLGGDEFLVVTENVGGRVEVEETARRVADALSAPHVLVGQERVVRPSVGTAIFPDDADDADGLLSASDDRMYRMKRGRAEARSSAVLRAPQLPEPD